MTWHKYDLTFRLLAPMHIGWRKTSNLMQSRGYVTGKVFWASLTARLTRDFDNGADGQRYQQIGQQVQEAFRFGYLYPALQKENGYQTYSPWQDDFDFDYHFLDSYASTALNYDSQSAEEGLLHETEFIAPYTRNGDPVYLRGALYVKETRKEPLTHWQDALQKLQFGGERSYGWGRVALAQPASQVGEVVGEEPAGELLDGRLPAHLHAAHVTNVNGPIEPLIGWERNNTTNGAAWKLSDNATICYAPGSQVAGNNTFQIGKDSLWHLAAT